MSLTDRFAMLWEDDGPPPDVFAFLKSHAGVSPRECVDVLLIDQHYRHRTGHGRAVEEYLREFPELAADAELKLDLVFGELRNSLVGRGGPPALDQFFARFPDLAEALTRQFEVADWMKTWTDSSPAESDTASILQATADELTVQDINTAAPRPTRSWPPQSARGSTGLEILSGWARGAWVWSIASARSRSIGSATSRCSTRGGTPSRSGCPASALRSGRWRGCRTPISCRFTRPERWTDGRISSWNTSTAAASRKLGGGPPPIRQAARIVQVLARAMSVAHQRGVVHRDLKPANILLTRDGRIKIADFGLATIDDAQESRRGSIVGTPAYMAPELAQGVGSGPSIDIYSLGATLYGLLTGRPPFQRPTTYGTLVQLLNQEPVPPGRLRPKLPRNLEAICLKCLEKEPRRRYLGAEELAKDLQAFLGRRRHRSAPRRSDKIARPHRGPAAGVAGGRPGCHARGAGYPAAG